MNLAKMRAGRERQLAEQRATHRDQVDRYREFLAAERSAFVRMMRIAELEGRDSDAFRVAQQTWRQLWSHVKLPTDAAFAAEAA